MAEQVEQSSKRQRCEASPEALVAAPAVALHGQAQAEAQALGAPLPEEPGFTRLERLCAPPALGGAGLSKAELGALAACGVHRVEAIAFLPLRRLQELPGMGELKARQVAAASRQLAPLRMLSCLEMLQVRQDNVRLTTGSSQLDRLLGGGLETGHITEVFGEFRSGKTQLCHTLCVTCQLPVESGGGESKALYVDTEGTFRPERLVSIAERYGLHEEDVLENVTCARAYNAEHQEKLLAEVGNVFCESRYALLIVDSATSLFRTDYSGLHELSERQRALNGFLRKLQRIADEHGVAVLVTNQVMGTAGGKTDVAGQQVAAVGGSVMGHASQTRLFFRKGHGTSRICRLHDSPSLPEGEALFAIATGGITDAY
uniref:DNA repair protein RAD51 n=1 Tax=Lingulaulax polyedra TaxID=160621 RepID=A0A516AG80_LINPO|nr:DNA repair protein RAD51 [Lingulodinium polyedra]